jgi:hypothetical protein
MALESTRPLTKMSLMINLQYIIKYIQWQEIKYVWLLIEAHAHFITS